MLMCRSESTVTQLQAASCKGEKEIVRVLLDKGVDVNAPSGRYGSALHAAIAARQKEIVGMLVETGANVNTREVESMITHYRRL